MRHVVSALVAAAAGILLVGCASTGAVGAHVQRGLTFSDYRSYDWGPADALPATDPRFAANQVLVDHVYGSVDTALQARGLERAATGTPDLLIHLHMASRHRIEMASTYRIEAGPEDAAGAGAIRHFDEGTLVIDVVDARRERVIWRGWVQQRADDMLRRPERIDTALEELFRRLPMGPAAGTGGR